MSVDISVIVPVFNDWDDVEVLNEGMRNQTLCCTRWEMIVVDNGSCQIPDKTRLPEFITLLSCSTPGSYAARNAGLNMASGELVVFTDADCRPNPDWLESHWDAFLQHGCNTLNAGAVKVDKLTSGPLNDYELYDRYLGIPQERYVKRRGYAVTANLAVPRVVFDRIGSFDENRLSGGDADFCQRAVKAGYTLRYIPEAEVLHPARSSWTELATKARRVKGGQICNGPLLRRAGFFFKSFLYPLLASYRVLRTKMSMDERKRIIAVIVRLGIEEIKEVFLLLLGKTPERR